MSAKWLPSGHTIREDAAARAGAGTISLHTPCNFITVGEGADDLPHNCPLCEARDELREMGRTIGALVARIEALEAGSASPAGGS